MPPKQKLLKHSHSVSAEPGNDGQSSAERGGDHESGSCRVVAEPGGNDGQSGGSCRVVLQPFMRDESSRRRYRFTALPAAASLYDKSALSDVRLRLMPTDRLFHAHRVILSASSDVFAAMLTGSWSESTQSELVLHEELDCARVFDRFLYFIYSGNVVISDDYVVPLFLLAGKYDVQSLYNECAKLIERALKVYVCADKEMLHASMSSSSSASDSSLSESTDMSDMSDVDDPSQAVKWMSSKRRRRRQYRAVDDAVSSAASTSRSMVASETFPVALVLRLLERCHGNERVRRAALLNLEARVGNQICVGNFTAIWLELGLDVIVAMLTDSRFGYPEMRLFEAAVAWLDAQPERAQLTAAVLRCIRYVLLSNAELYEVECKSLVRACDEVAALVHDAMRHRLFHEHCSAEDRARWTGAQFAARSIPRV